MNELIQLPQYDLEGRRIPDSAVLWWHNTTQAEQDNIRLKMQVDALIKSNAAITTLAEDLKPAIKFFNTEPEDVPAPKKRISAKQKKQQAFEAHKKMLELKALEKVMNSNKNGG